MIKIPILGKSISKYIRSHDRASIDFESTGDYWETRYRNGGTSGSGSYGKLALFKAEVLNSFVQKQGIRSVIEFGCGDGAQLNLARYPQYTGYDLSRAAIDRCVALYSKDDTKNFLHVNQYQSETAELVISLDVIFHLVEESVYLKYMERLFSSSTKYVVIYSSNSDANIGSYADHVRHRKFTDWIHEKATDWQLIKHVPNTFPYTQGGDDESFADFYIFGKKSSI
tara:strand:+ start:2633 stop:3310 length:678 start_codon:yes stop_codon:yes gene_type:complete